MFMEDLATIVRLLVMIHGDMRYLTCHLILHHKEDGLMQAITGNCFRMIL